MIDFHWEYQQGGLRTWVHSVAWVALSWVEFNCLIVQYTHAQAHPQKTDKIYSMSCDFIIVSTPWSEYHRKTFSATPLKTFWPASLGLWILYKRIKSYPFQFLSPPPPPSSSSRQIQEAMVSWEGWGRYANNHSLSSLVLHRVVCISVFAALGAWPSCLHFLYLQILAAGQRWQQRPHPTRWQPCL